MEKISSEKPKKKKPAQKMLAAMKSFIVPAGIGALASAVFLNPLPWAVGLATGSVLASKKLLSNWCDIIVLWV